MKPAVLFAGVALCSAALAAAEKTVWDGVYTAAQATRGRVQYDMYCKSCHAEDLSGGDDGGEQVPPLRKENFAVTRRELNNLYTFVSQDMPKNDPGSLEETTYIDIVSYVLQKNGFPAGSAELKPDAELLESILFVKKPE